MLLNPTSSRHEEPDVGVSGASNDVSPLFNGHLCAGACEIIPRTFAQSVGLFNLITLTPFVCLRVHCPLFLAYHQSTTDFDADGVCGSPIFAPPSTSARVQSCFEFVEAGGGMCSNYHRRHWDYRLVPQAGTSWYHALYTRAQYICTRMHGMYRCQRFTCAIPMNI